MPFGPPIFSCDVYTNTEFTKKCMLVNSVEPVKVETYKILSLVKSFSTCMYQNYTLAQIENDTDV